MKGLLKTAGWVLLVVVLIAGLAKVRATRVKQLAMAPKIQPAVSSVQVAKVRLGQVTSTIDEQGVLEAKTESAVASQVMARCLSVTKREGDSVRAGEVIARLDDQELQDIQDAQNAQVLSGQAAAAAQSAQVARAREDAAARAADVKAGEAAVSVALSKVDAARQTTAAHLSDVEGARQTVAAMLSDVEGARQTMAAQQAEVERTKENLAAAESAAATQQSRTARDKILYDNKAISLEQWEASQTAEVQATAAVGALKRQIDSLNRSVDAANARVAALLSGVDAAKKRVESLESVAEASKQSVASLQAGVKAARERVASLQAMEGDARQRIVAQQESAASAAHQARALASTANRGRTRIGYTVIRAPYDAIVTARLAEPGDLLVPGRPIYRLLKPGSVKVVVNVPQESLALMWVGTPAKLSAGDQETWATVSRVYPALTGSHLGTIEIDLPRPPFELKSGATLNVSLEIQSQRGVVVPVASLLESDQGQFVFTVQDGAVKSRPVSVEVRGAKEAVITGEVKSADEVVVARSSELMTLHDGQKVHPVTAEGSGQ